MATRLKNETSLYLRQHCHDPVDWYSWSDEAFEEAKKRDLPVFLSIGYSSCHWCHVMAHESFQDFETAEVLNRHFVCIKVDREERPDIDDAYMTAVQLATGHGGWPMTVFMTPDKKPFFAGTYFPRESRGDFPGFRHLAASLGQAWGAQRDEMVKSSEEFAETVRNYLGQSVGAASPELTLDIIDKAVEELHHDFDFENGGFGTRPKFPPHATLRFLLDYASRRHALAGDAERVDSLCEQSGHMALMTLEKIALGGIHDHVGGGFHRYSTDAEWMLPHFEKMLSDNALFVSNYCAAASMCGDERLQKLFRETADKAVDWIIGTLGAQDGTYWTSVDADSEGEEGLFYTWTSDEIGAMLPVAGESFMEAFSVEASGNFRDEATHRKTGQNVLYLGQDCEGGFDMELAVLRESRAARAHPSVDDKSVAALDGLVISALVASGRIDRAQSCASAWCAEFERLGHVPHLMGKGLGFLDDYSAIANGLIDLYEVTNEERWRSFASAVADQMVERFRIGGLFCYTSGEHERLFGRSVPALDSSVPSALAEAIRSIYRLGRGDEARSSLLGSLGWMQRTARAAHSLLHVAFVDFLDNPDAHRAVTQSRREKIGLFLDPPTVFVNDGGWVTLEAVLKVPAGMHISSHDPTALWLTPTTLRAEGVFAEASFPSSSNERFVGEVRVPIKIRPLSGSSEFKLSVKYQLCSEHECFLPDEVLVTGYVTVPEAL